MMEEELWLEGEGAEWYFKLICKDCCVSFRSIRYYNFCD